MDPGRIEAGQKELDRMLMTLWRAGYVTLEPQPPTAAELAERCKRPPAEEKAEAAKRLEFTFGFAREAKAGRQPEPPPYQPMFARPTENLAKLLAVPRHQSALRRVSGEPIGHCRPQRADSGDGERVGVAAVGGPFRARAEAGRAAARPAGHAAARSAPAATGPGHAGRAFAIGRTRRRTAARGAPTTTRSGRGC